MTGFGEIVATGRSALKFENLPRGWGAVAALKVVEMDCKDSKSRAGLEAYLTPDERQRLREIAERTSEIDAERRLLTKERKRIIDRAGKREVSKRNRAAGLELRWAPKAQKVDTPCNGGACQ